jgi:iron complex outermembrane receptor protein
MRETTMKINRTILATATLAATFSLESYAQLMLEEVIVTAQKREASLQDTAIAITALTSESFDALNIKNSTDFEAIVPSLSVRNAPRRLFLRGVGRTTGSLGTDPGVAVYNDQIYGSSIGAMNRVSSLTTERIEVLRGPQGTLFGRNATGGAINITSLRPTEEFEHHARATVGNLDRFNWGVSSAGPITDSLRYRVHASRNERDGYVENLSGDDVFSEDWESFGAQLSWDVSDSLNVWVKYAKDERDDIRLGVFPGGYTITPYLPELKAQSSFLLSEQYQWDKENPAVKDPRKVDVNDPLEAITDGNNRWTTHVTWDLENITVKYIGNYTESSYDASGGDIGYTSNPDLRMTEFTTEEQESYSHELQFLSAGDGPLQWVAGLYFYKEDLEQSYGARNNSALYLSSLLPTGSFNSAEIVPHPDPGLQYLQTPTLESESRAAYLDMNYSFSDSWKLTVGLRYSEDEKDGYEEQLVVLDPNVYGVDYPAFGFPETCCGWLETDPEEANRELDDEWDNLSGRVVLEWMPSDDAMVYASVSTGYKSGGFRLGTLQPNPSFDEEEVLSYEIGYKGTFGGTFQLNAAAFFYDYTDMQVLVNAKSPEGIVLPEMTNADEAEIKGIELEAVWLATEHLTLMANYSYLDGEYTDFCCSVDTIADPDGEEQDLSGNPLTQAPENKLFFNAAYSIPTNSAGEFILSGSYSWVDERQYDIFNTPETLADDYYRLDAMVTWISPSENIRVIAAGRNLTEEDTWESLERANEFGAISGLANEPRIYTLEVQYDF